MTEDNRRFYEEKVKPLIHERFGTYEERIVGASEDIGYDISEMLKEEGLITRINPYLEADVDVVLGKH